MTELILENIQNKLEFTKEYEDLIKSACEKTLLVEAFDHPCEISVTICDSEQIKGINKEFRGIDKETDVLSFPMIEGEPKPTDYDGEWLILGDIVLNLEKVLSQSKEYGHSFSRELSFLTVHSMLHLLGYDHEEEEERKEMRAKEEEILAQLSQSRL